jgi:hypothetical protein
VKKAPVKQAYPAVLWNFFSRLSSGGRFQKGGLTSLSVSGMMVFRGGDA